MSRVLFVCVHNALVRMQRSGGRVGAACDCTPHRR
jgi:hypothetical protein